MDSFIIIAIVALIVIILISMGKVFVLNPLYMSLFHVSNIHPATILSASHGYEKITVPLLFVLLKYLSSAKRLSPFCLLK